MDYNNNQNNEVMTTGQWLLTMLILAIPCANIVMLFVWAFGNGNENRKNYCRATLIWIGIMLVLCLILSLFFGALISSLQY